LVIASSDVNENHGSTLSFTTVNPSNTAEYRKFVINQGNWGARYNFLDFGLSSSTNMLNPHLAINTTDTTLTLDGVSKRVGIGTMNPTNTLEVVGTTTTNALRMGTGSFGYVMKKFGSNNGNVSFVFNLRLICNWSPGIVKIRAAANDGSSGRHFAWHWTFSFQTVFCGGTSLNVLTTLEGGNPGATYFEHSLNPSNGLYTLTALSAGRHNVIAECEISHHHGIYS
jgi:hypothetical protein